MTSYPKAIVRLIGISGVGFNNAKSHTEIKTRLLPLGYDDPKLDGLIILNSQTDTKYHAFETKFGEQLEATKALDMAFDTEMVFYSDFRKLCFHIFGGDEYNGFRSQLGIDEKTKTAFAPFIEQAKQFYETVINKPQILAGLSEFGVTVEKMQARLDGLSTLKRLNENQESKKGAAQLARKERDDSYDELAAAWAKFRTACNIVFRDTPQNLKILNADQPATPPRQNTDENPDDQTPPADPADPAAPTDPTNQ